ncbi:MAG: hypothetical protein FRX48_02702 [Lasallia pustulata]|uniref:Tetratricopeptide-like helical domain n=1 Tax=Lasallia pustulata TaxID=136370 RepID=A0A5M8PZ38_9LECA|nr:MAG: hypothetical protein FRX48_02702 [Lasallia pustulata]
MGILKAFSLIDADDRETNYRMHDLVHLATQEWLESRGQRATYEKGALQVLADKFPSGESQQWDQCKKIYPHAGVVEHFDTSSASTSLQKARLKQKMANYLRAQDQYDPAMKRHEEAAEVFEKERGTRDLETLNNMSDMGLTLTYQGYSTKGERLLRTAASGIEEIQGTQDLNTMNHLARLAENLLCQAKFSTAERIYRRVYTNRKAILGEGHLDTLLSLSYLGPPLEWLGRLEESEDVNQRAVGGMQRILPVHHASLYLAEIKLGFILQKRGKLEEAESSARRSLENRLAIYGPGHKWVGWSTQTLSLTLRDQGRHEEALYHSKAVVQMREREFPANHILVIKAIYTLAFLYHGLQGYDQASIHYLDCLARAQMSYGLLHPLPVAIRAQYLRMIERMTDVELNWRTCVSPRAFWMTLSPKQFSILAHFVGVPDPQRHNRNVGVELLETYCFVLVTYARQLWHRVMHMVIIGLIILSVILNLEIDEDNLLALPEDGPITEQLPAREVDEPLFVNLDDIPNGQELSNSDPNELDDENQPSQTAVVPNLLPDQTEMERLQQALTQATRPVDFNMLSMASVADDPVSEWDSKPVFRMAFPGLFPYGRGDFYERRGEVIGGGRQQQQRREAATADAAAAERGSSSEGSGGGGTSRQNQNGV